jgi:cyclic-di-GMP phosphodiesterase TipF (flagellum assembly factor)
MIQKETSKLPSEGRAAEARPAESRPVEGPALQGQSLQGPSLPGAPAPRAEVKPLPASRDGLVYLCMTTVSAAFAAMLYTQLSFAAPAAVVIAGAALATFLLIHKQVQKNAQIAHLRSEVRRLEHKTRAASMADDAGNPMAAGASARGPRMRRRPVSSAPTPESGPAVPFELTHGLPSAMPAPNAAVHASAAAAAHRPEPSADMRLSAEPGRAPRAAMAKPAKAEPSFSEPSFDAAAFDANESAQSAKDETAAQHQPATPEGISRDLLTNALDSVLLSAPTGFASSHHQGAPSTPPAASETPVRDQWSFRPRKDGPEIGPGMMPQAAGEAAAAAQTPSAMTIETDLEVVQRKIKELAEEVNASDALRQMESQQPQPKDAKAKAPASEPSPPVDPIESSIEALKAVVGTMRERREPMSKKPSAKKMSDGLFGARSPFSKSPLGELVIPATAEPITSSELPEPVLPMPEYPSQESSAQNFSAPDAAAHTSMDSSIGAPPPRNFDLGFEPAFGFGADAAPAAFETPNLDLPAAPGSESGRLRAIASAIEAGRMDMFLSPIVGLSPDNHAVSHYEVNLRLKSVDGSHIDHTEDELMLAGSDLVAMFDIARLNRSAVLAQRLEARGKDGSLLSDVAGTSLTNTAFLDNFTRIREQRARISQQLVLTMSQTAVEQFSASAWQALEDMQTFGFRFALDKVRHAATDFADLQRRGFAFVKLDAMALTDGLTANGQFVPADDVCRRIAGAGMAVIASGVDDEAMRARIFGFGILLGQGQLFGGARPVNVGNTTPRNTSAAA